MLIQRYGDRGILISKLRDRERFLILSSLEKRLPEGCDEHVAGYDSVLFLGGALDSQWVADYVNSVISEIEPDTTQENALHEIPVVYDGTDLDSVAAAINLSPQEVIRIHSEPLYTVRMMGFSPGFPYLDGLDQRLCIERRTTPRKRIKPGSVAIGGPHAGIYSVASPGGWHLLGRTDFSLFNIEAGKSEHPKPQKVFALSIGDRVRFKPLSP